MSRFQVQDAFGGNAVGFSPNYPSVEIAFDPAGCGQHGGAFVLSSPLASKCEIDEVINSLIADLETVRTLAAQKLVGYQKRAEPE